LTQARDYISHGSKKVPGHFLPEDMRLFVLVDEAQKTLGLTGNLMEIGVFKGKSAVLLGYLTRPGEDLVVCDLFGGPATNTYSEVENAAWYGDLDSAAFEANYLQFHSELPTVVVGPSSMLRDRCAPASYRLIHIDGSHMYPDVMGDLLLSRDLVSGPDAVVIIDDIVTAYTPGVWAAAWECVHLHGLVPIVVSKKMYATWGEPSPEFARKLRALIAAEADLAILEHPLAAQHVVLQVANSATPTRRARFALDWLPPKLRRAIL